MEGLRPIKIPLVLLLLYQTALATISVDSLQMFTNGTVGSVITDAALANGKKGLGSWSIWSTGSVYHAWFVASNAPVAFPSPVLVNGETYTTTGNQWMRWTNGAGSPAGTPVESMSFFLPGGAGGAFQRLTVRLFMRLNITNLTGTAENFDHIDIEGNPFGVIQQQTVSDAGNAVIAHAGGGNGAWITNLINRLYFVVLRYDLGAQTMTVRLYDAENGFGALPQSVATLNNTGNVWWVRFQANYAYIGAAQGWHEMTAPSFEWTTDGSDLGGVTATIGSATLGNMVIGP